MKNKELPFLIFMLLLALLILCWIGILTFNYKYPLNEEWVANITSMEGPLDLEICSRSYSNNCFFSRPLWRHSSTKICYTFTFQEKLYTDCWYFLPGNLTKIVYSEAEVRSKLLKNINTSGEWCDAINSDCTNSISQSFSALNQLMTQTNGTAKIRFSSIKPQSRNQIESADNN